MMSPLLASGARALPSLDGAYETIIVGAGIAGLACARRLHDAGRPFLIISQDVGGRIQRSRDDTVNLGAYYVRADYTHVNRYVRLGRRIDQLRIRRHDGSDSYTYWDGRLVLHLAQATRFLRLLVEFHRRYGAFKERTVTIGQPAALRADPWLLSLYHQPASDFIDEHRASDLARWYLAPGVHGTTFTTLHDVTAFTLLLGALPALVPAYEFTPRIDRLTAGFADAIYADTVTGLHCHGAGYRIDTLANGTLDAERVVIATPTDVAKQLLRMPVTRRPVSAHLLQVRGSLRAPYRRADIHLFAETDPTLAIAQQESGAVLVSSRHARPDLGRYFSEWDVLEHKHWNPAFHLLGAELLEADQRPNLYLIGDHNIVGLEDAYLTGVYAANRIIGATGPWDRPPKRRGAPSSLHGIAPTIDC